MKFSRYISEDTTAALKKKAEKTGIPLSVLRKVYNRGMAAWKTGHRPGTTPQQWGMARVNSYITKGKGTYHGADKDLRGKNESTLDEISDKAVDNYRKAAIKSYNKSANYFANQGYEPNPKSVAKHRENQRRRDRGIGSAYKRDLAKSSGQKYIHKPTYTKALAGGDKNTAPQLTTKSTSQLHKRYKDR